MPKKRAVDYALSKMFEFTLESVGTISILRLRGAMEMPDIPLLSAYCSLGRSILVVDLLETKKLLPEGRRILLDAAVRVKKHGGGIVLVATPEQASGDDFSLSDEFVICRSRDEAISCAEMLHRRRLVGSITIKMPVSDRNGLEIPEIEHESAEARKVKLEQELKALRRQRDRALEQNRLAGKRVEVPFRHVPAPAGSPAP